MNTTHMHPGTSLRGRRSGFSLAARGKQQGVALVIALLLLVVITLVGFAAVRGTIVQQKMATNLYDREVAFQSAEAAMRAAAAVVASSPGQVARNCQAGGVVCMANPFEDPSITSADIYSVSTSQYTADSVATGQPQYVIEDMGNYADPNSSTGFNQTANSHQYQAQGVSTTAVFYRITARSGDPAVVNDRAVVTLQAVIKQG